MSKTRTKAKAKSRKIRMCDCCKNEKAIVQSTSGQWCCKECYNVVIAATSVLGDYL